MAMTDQELDDMSALLAWCQNTALLRHEREVIEKISARHLPAIRARQDRKFLAAGWERDGAGWSMRESA